MSVAVNPGSLASRARPGEVSADARRMGRRVVLILLGLAVAVLSLPFLLYALFPVRIGFFMRGCPTGYVQLAGEWHYVSWNFWTGSRLNFAPIDCDPETFRGMEAVNGPFAIDARSGFCRHERIPGSDPATFAPFTEQQLYGFSHDARHVYFRTEIVEQADPATFRTLENGYNRDATRLYRYDQLIAGADPDSWRVVEYTGYAVDRQHVFLRDRMIPEADPESFAPIMDENDWCTGYARDAMHVFLDYAIVLEADPETFHVLTTDRPPGFRHWADRDHVFLRGEIVPDAHPDTFEPYPWKN